VDEDESYLIGETKYYAVTSEDIYGNQSGKTSFTTHSKNIAAVNQLAGVYAVPNPFIRESGFTGSGQEKTIGFYGLPERCTIRIFSFAGQLVETIEHDEDVFYQAWFQVTRNNQDVASGVYFYVVTTPAGEQVSGKLIIIK